MGDEQSIDSEFGDAPVAVADASPNGTADHGAMEAEASAASVAATSEPAAEPTEAESAESPDFLTQLARAMQATAGAERGRASEEIDRRSNTHIAAIRARAEAEALKMRDLAGDDRRAIERWAETEQQRIKAERDRRTKELEADLTQSLAEHGRQTDVQIQAVEAVVAKHRADVDTFFTSLDGETDPVRFAQRAGQRPAFPDLDRLSTPTSSDATATQGDVAEGSVRATMSADDLIGLEPAPDAPTGAAAATAEADAEPVPVMDPVARLGLLKHSPEPSPFAKPVTAAGGTPAVRTVDPDPDDPSIANAVATPQPQHSGPIGWLRRNSDQGK